MSDPNTPLDNGNTTSPPNAPTDTHPLMQNTNQNTNENAGSPHHSHQHITYDPATHEVHSPHHPQQHGHSHSHSHSHAHVPERPLLDPPHPHTVNHSHPHSHASHSGHGHGHKEKRNSKHVQKHLFFSGRLKELLLERQTAQKQRQRDPDAPHILEQSEVVVDVYHFSPTRLDRKSTSNVDEINATPPDWATVAWVNVDGINETILKKISLEFDLHPIAVEDVVEIQHRPKLDFFGDVMFMITSIVSKNPQPSGKVTLVTEQVSFFLVGKTLISIQQGIPGDIWGDVRTSILDQDSITRNSDTGFLLYLLLAGIVDTCKPIVDELEDTLEDLEVAMMENPSHHLNKMVYAVKRHQITLRSILFPTRKILQRILPEEANNNDLDNPGPFVNNGLRSHPTASQRLPTRFEGVRIFSSVTSTYFRDLFGVITHLCEQMEQQKEVAASLTSLHLNHQAQRQGTASYAIAIVSVFFLPLTFVAGVYGMNFVHMPELQWQKGYLYVWMIFIGVVLFEILVFRSVGWIEFKITKRISRLFGLKRKAGSLPPKYYRASSLISADSSNSAVSDAL